MDDTESEGDDHDGDYDKEKPWLAEWNHYEKTHEAIPESMGIVRWWGVRMLSSILLWILIPSLAQCISIPNMGVPCSRLPCYYGFIGLQ